MPQAEATLITPETTADIATLAAAQRDMRNAYYDGAPGVLVSGLAWAAATGVAAWVTPERAVWTLFIGGACIHPLAALLGRLLGRSGQHGRGNPLAPLAMATTVWMIMMLPLAYAVALWRIDLFFPAMLMVIGGRYLCFPALYGMRIYWPFGAVLGLAAYGLAVAKAPPAAGALAGAAIEIVFAGLIFAGAQRRS